MTAREEVERLLAEHALTAPRGCSTVDRCRCGRRTVDHCAHVAQVLDEAGLLAEPEGKNPFDPSRLYHGTCPRCGEHKFIGHGPLCVDCLTAQPAAVPGECDDLLCGSDPHEHHGDAIEYLPKPAAAPSEGITPGGNPVCPLCGHWYGPGDHECAEPSEDVEALGNLIPLGWDPARDGVSNVHEAARRILASDWLAAHDAQVRADERQRVQDRFIAWLVQTLHYPFDFSFAHSPPPVDHDRLADYWNAHDNWDIPAEDARSCVRDEAGLSNNDVV